MITFTISIVVNQPLDTVVDALMNPDNFPFWQTDLEKFESISGKSGQIGSIGRLHYKQKGQSYIMEDRLIYCEPKKKYISEVSGEAIFATVETSLKDLRNSTEVKIIWSGRGKILLLRLILPFMRGKMIKQSKKELERFKYLLETQGAIFKEEK